MSDKIRFENFLNDLKEIIKKNEVEVIFNDVELLNSITYTGGKLESYSDSFVVVSDDGTDIVEVEK